MIYAGITIWLALGVVGYLMMRQGFLVSYERILGKEKAWDWSDKIGIIFSIMGPIFILIAILVKGKSCFKKRTHKLN